jgi:hypothetical protein
LDVLITKLGDPSKLVQRTAAWAVRQIYSRHTETDCAKLTAAIGSADDRVRWGATRVFATHFSALARKHEFAAALEGQASDPYLPVRMQALKGLWQFWFWTPDDAVKSKIEDVFLSSIAGPQHPWVEQNLREGIYNIADENIRYLYNNWVPLLARDADRERVIAGRLKIEDRLASKFARVLADGSNAQRKVLLAALTQYPLRQTSRDGPLRRKTNRGGPVEYREGQSDPFEPAPSG